MKPFRFRAEAALDVRRRIEDDARKALMAAEERARQAEIRVNDATQASRVAQDALRTAQTIGITGSELSWHQSWIARQRLEVDARSRDAATSAASVERAVTSVRAAHQQRRTLERLRERMAQRHRVDTTRHEQRDVDQLAGLRYSAQAISQGGHEIEHERNRRHERHVADPGPDGSRRRR